VTDTWNPDVARARLLELVRERAYREGVDIVLASGKRSTFYVNGKRVTLHPEGLYLTARLMLLELENWPRIQAIGGLTLGADPIASAVSALSFVTGQNINAFLVRKERKGHGTGGLIEGDLEPGEPVAIVEDTITTGGSAQQAISAVAEMGAVTEVVLALVDRGDEDAASFRSEYPVRSLINISDLREKAGG
jgi:orotate phosphoribosyltransferase